MIICSQTRQIVCNELPINTVGGVVHNDVDPHSKLLRVSPTATNNRMLQPVKLASTCFPVVRHASIPFEL